MRTVGGVLKEQLSELDYCIDKLRFRDNGHQTEDYEYLLRYLIGTRHEMKQSGDSFHATRLYLKKVAWNVEIRRLLKSFGIEL